MNKQSGKRKYRNSLQFVESGFRACWRNAQDLVFASQKLIDIGLYAPALSIAILALEELGKLMAIDGLLSARPDDYKTTTFDKSLRDHSAKLALLEVLPLLLLNLSRTDPRYGKEQRFNQALALSGLDLKEAGNVVMKELEATDFAGLNRWKQRGFLVHVMDQQQRFVAPRDAIRPSLAKAVHYFAWRATTTLDFILKNENLERYIENARSVRARLSEEQHQELEALGNEQFAKIFRSSGDDSE